MSVQGVEQLDCLQHVPPKGPIQDLLLRFRQRHGRQG
jgi:hypothetical protein